MPGARVVLALAASLALVGCSAPTLSGGTDGTNDQTGGGSPVVEVPVPEDTSEAVPPGGAETPGGALPANFPRDVPVIDGPVLVAVDLGTGWALWIGVEDPALAFAQATSALDAAGFDRIAVLSGTTSLASYSSAAYSVQLLARDDPIHGNSISYTITRN